MRSRNGQFSCNYFGGCTLIVVLFHASLSAGQYLPVWGGRTYTPVTNGTFSPRVSGVSDAGVAYGTAAYYDAGVLNGFTSYGFSAGVDAFSLDDLGAPGYRDTPVYAVSPAGTVVGSTQKTNQGTSLGNRAVCWDSAGQITELPFLTQPNSKYGLGVGLGVNDVGGIAGQTLEQSTRAIRWDHSGNPILLNSLPGLTAYSAWYVNSSGATAGYGMKREAGKQAVDRPMRWSPTGEAEELGVLGTDVNGLSNVRAGGLNDAGTVFSTVTKYDSAGRTLGPRAVIWLAGNSTAIELPTLGKDSSGVSYAYAGAINQAGLVVGYSDEFDSAGNLVADSIPVIWDSSGNIRKLNVPTKLKFKGAMPEDLNDLGEAVGSLFSPGHAVYWDSTGNPTDLNDLIDPQSGWILNRASYISNNGWITGTGMFDPDGKGGQAAYTRQFLLLIPEPSCALLMTIVFLFFVRHTRTRLQSGA